MEERNYREMRSGDGKDVLVEWKSCLMEDEEWSLPRVRSPSVARGNGFCSKQHQHPPVVRSPSSPTYSFCSSRLRWVNIVEQLLLGVTNSHSPVNALSALPHTKKELCNVNGEVVSRRQLRRRNRDTHHANEISFISVAHFSLGRNGRVFETSFPVDETDEGGIFATDHTTLSSPASTSLIQTQEFTSNSFSSGVCCKKDCNRTSERFISFFAMPVPESFRSTWSTEHVPSLHISASPDKLQKLKELRRDDNYNIEVGVTGL
nr:uncharacterized protein LOC129254714 [Lytechinus pictus]